MRTTVRPTNHTYEDPEEGDEFPGCAGSADAETGELVITDDTNAVEATYERGEWKWFQTYAD